MLESAELLNLVGHFRVLHVLPDHLSQVGLAAIVITDPRIEFFEGLDLELIVVRNRFSVKLPTPELELEFFLCHVFFARLGVLVGIHQLAISLACDLVEFRRGNEMVWVVHVLLIESVRVSSVNTVFELQVYLL